MPIPPKPEGIGYPWHIYMTKVLHIKHHHFLCKHCKSQLGIPESFLEKDKNNYCPICEARKKKRLLIIFVKDTQNRKV